MRSGAGEQLAGAVEYDDLQAHPVAEGPGGGAPCGSGDSGREVNAGGVRVAECFHGGVGLADARRESGVAARVGGDLGQPVEIDFASAGVQVQQALPQLGHLRHAAGDGDERDWVAAKIFQHAADEIAHVDQRLLGQFVQPRDRCLGGRTGRAGDVLQARGAGDVDAAMDRMDPGGAGIGHDDAGGAQDGQAAGDAEAAVQCAFGEFLAAGDGQFDYGIAGAGEECRGFGNGCSDHLPWDRVDGRFAGRHGQAGPGDGADTLAGLECNAAAGSGETDGGDDQSAVGHVGVVASVLDDSGASEILAAFGGCQGEAGTPAARQKDADRVGECAGQQSLIGGAAGGGGAGSGGPAAAQWAIGLHGLASYRTCAPGARA